ncbi:MAG: hypothetical protein ACU0CI_01605 [Shimia sp.]
MGLAIHRLLDAPDLAIDRFIGRTDCLVIACAGIGKDPTLPPPLEFFGSATEQGRHHLIFVADRRRSWLNAPGMEARVLSVLSEQIAQIAPRRLALIGNSMGGTIALLLARNLPVDAVLAMVPQWTVNPALLPEETRWRRWRKRIDHWPNPTVGAIETRGRDVFILHGDTPSELMHAQLFPDDPALDHWILAGCGHRVALRLKRSEKLDKLVSRCLWGEPEAARKLLTRINAIRRYPLPADRALPSPPTGIASRT